MFLSDLCERVDEPKGVRAAGWGPLLGRQWNWTGFRKQEAGRDIIRDFRDKPTDSKQPSCQREGEDRTEKWWEGSKFPWWKWKTPCSLGHIWSIYVCLSQIMLRFLHFAANILKFKGFMGKKPTSLWLCWGQKTKSLCQPGIVSSALPRITLPTFSGWVLPISQPFLLLFCLRDRCHPCSKDPKGTAITNWSVYFQ